MQIYDLFSDTCIKCHLTKGNLYTECWCW